VHDAHDPLDWVKEDNRQAIGSENPQGVAWNPGDQGIPLFPPNLFRLSAGFSFENNHATSMDLASGK
jgi:hypothetical protein